jgi:transcriptional regulator with XRE-family HTH domain
VIILALCSWVDPVAYSIQNTCVPDSEQLGSLPGTSQLGSAGMADMYSLLAGATTVGERIRRLLQERGMTLGDLHRRSGVAKGYLSELVNEDQDSRRKPSAETLYAIGTALGASVADLLGKTRPTEEMSSWPPGLAEYVTAGNVPPEEARMLAGISARGRTPRTPEDWKAVHRMIQLYSEGSAEHQP